MRFKIFDKRFPAPHREEGNAGYDLFSRDEIELLPGETGTVRLNFACEIPEGFVGLVFQRSSTYRKWGVRLTNSVGVIDSSYCGDGDEWQAEFQNMTRNPMRINQGDKVCQALFMPVALPELMQVASLGNEDRGGFGTSFDNAKELV